MSQVPEFENRESEDYKIVFASGVFGGLSPIDGRIILYVDRLVPEPVRGRPGRDRIEKVIRERQVEIHVTPATWKSIASWMQGHVERFEKRFGTIPQRPKGAKEEPSTVLAV